MLLIPGSIKQMLVAAQGVREETCLCHLASLEQVAGHKFFIWISLWLVFLSISPSVIVGLVDGVGLLLCLRILCPFSSPHQSLPLCGHLPSTALSCLVVLG